MIFLSPALSRKMQNKTHFHKIVQLSGKRYENRTALPEFSYSNLNKRICQKQA